MSEIFSRETLSSQSINQSSSKIEVLIRLYDQFTFLRHTDSVTVGSLDEQSALYCLIVFL